VRTAKRSEHGGGEGHNHADRAERDPDGVEQRAEADRDMPDVAERDPVEADGAEAEAEGPQSGWGKWLDGRPHRLTRGKHYSGDPKVVVRRAREAAAALGKTAVTSLQSQGKYEYLWIQFVDGQVEQGHPCPICGSFTLEKVQKYFLRCSSCRSTLKATDDWEVTAGKFLPAPSEEEVEAAADEEGGSEEPGRRAGEIAELLDARLLSADGEETLEPRVTEEFFVEFGIRFVEPIEWAIPRVRLSVGKNTAVLRVQPPRALRVPEPETLQARVRIPANLLMPKSYTVELVVLLFPDLSDLSRYERLIDPKALTFKVVKPPRGGPRKLDPYADLGSPLDWEIGERPNDAEDAEPMG
jgi:hypothetical protein